jgi:hypothetical protein
MQNESSTNDHPLLGGPDSNYILVPHTEKPDPPDHPVIEGRVYQVNKGV